MLVNLYTCRSKLMKKFLIGITIFFVVIIVADTSFGKVMVYAESQSSSKNYHCMYEADEDILVLGSSFAVRNIVPSLIEDSLGLSCYNAGEAGNGALVAWARYNMFIKNHTPQLIIYTLTPSFDYVKSDEYSKYLNTLKPYYGKDESVTELYANLMERADGFMLNSNFMKFNSYCAQLVYYWLGKKNVGLQGYEPLYDVFKPYENDSEQKTAEYQIDCPKMAYLEMLFADIKLRKIPVICVLTPDYRDRANLDQYNEGLQLCERFDIPVLNHKYCEGITQNAQYFYDISHLNDKGAKLYTSFLSKEIQHLINNNCI